MPIFTLAGSICFIAANIPKLNEVAITTKNELIFDIMNQEKINLKTTNAPSRLGDVIRIPIQFNFAGGYRLEYDGKYITLIGRDRAHPGFKFAEEQEDWFEESVLIPVVIEIRKANPQIIEVTANEIIVKLGCV